MEPLEGASRNRVGRYHLVERLAVGGMAEVFLACERGTHALDRLLVIKRILPHLADNDEFVQMFMTEARLAARINHPNVVQIYELGEAGGFPFIAMEYVSGSTLKELVKASRKAETRLPLAMVVHLMAQACAGAHAAHELTAPDGTKLNLVHRDLSPHNLMVTDDALVKLLDFGIAKAEQGMDHTRTGMLKGKVSYMSPEQCKQLKLDRRSDIYALGIVMWELLAGHKMFFGMSELATMQAIVTGDLKDVRESRPDVPQQLLDVMKKAMAQKPDDRYDTADAMRRALLDAAEAASISVDEDRAGRFVRTLLGEVHEARRQQVSSALEKTLVTLSRAEPPDTDDIQRSSSHTETSAGPIPPRALTQTTVATSAASASAGMLIGGAATMVLVTLLGIGAMYFFELGIFAPDPDAPPPEIIPEGAPVYVTIAPTLSPEELTEDLNPLRLYLQAKVDRPVKFQIADSYDDASQKVLKGEVHYGLLPYNTLMKTLEKDATIPVFAHEVVDGSEASDGYLVVAQTSDADTVQDLVGGTLCYTDELSSTGYKLPRRYLRKKGLDPDKDFKPHFSGNHQQVLRDVIDGTCDVGGTYAGNYSTATQAGIPVARLRILVPRTGSTPHDGWVASHDADSEITERMRKALLAFNPKRDIQADRLGEKKRVTGYVVPEPEWLQQDDPEDATP
ncbi:MAG: PhnD/SsuA/transferrin family substrate-binding protein [Alphaproteobacteria bacterium]|nr:PhnD/SsuA/transferrin family substrate-binding protein [Alphaproteobacteria bacterium]